MTKYDRQAWASATAQMDLIATGQTTPEEAVEGFKEEMKNIYPEIENRLIFSNIAASWRYSGRVQREAAF